MKTDALRATVSVVVIATCVLALASCNGDVSQETTDSREKRKQPHDLTDIVGIEIGGSQSLTECEKSYHSTTGISYASFPKVTPCWTYPLFGEEYKASMKTMTSLKSFPPSIEDGTTLEVDLGYGKMPEGVLGNGLITLINGRIEGISLDTRACDQSRINSLLVQKYGPPTVTNIGKLQNSFGAQFSRIESQWDMPRMIVFFYGISGDPDEGLIHAGSPALAKWQQANDSKNKNSF
jgi:hypothetical protein